MENDALVKLVKIIETLDDHVFGWKKVLNYRKFLTEQTYALKTLPKLLLRLKTVVISVVTFLLV